MRKAIIIIVSAFVVFGVIGAAIKPSADPMADAKASAKALSANNTAKRVAAIYARRGIHVRVTCVDVSATKQKCTAKRNGQVVARLTANIDLPTGTVDVQPE